jgi:hypothetical protein
MCHFIKSSLVSMAQKAFPGRLHDRQAQGGLVASKDPIVNQPAIQNLKFLTNSTYI